MLTSEQKSVVESNADKIIVNAGAGSGKTTTLYNFAQARPQQRILYLAFNKSMQQEAEEKFNGLDKTEVRTVHSLAYGQVGYKYKNKLSYKYKTYQLAQDLGYDFSNPNQVDLLAEVNRLFKNYLRSSAFSIEDYLDDLRQELKNPKDKILELLKKVFELKKNPNNDIDITHNFYLKLYQLTKPQLDYKYDLLLLDEAQDINEVIIDIFKRQDMKKVAVGDSNQQIYAWNGAVDALQKISGEKYYLTHSFRIGEELAQICNLLLHDFKGDRAIKIKAKNENQRVGEVNRNSSYTKLCRTRAKVFDNAVAKIKKGRRIYFEGGVYSYNFSTFIEAWKFRQGEPYSDPLLVPFSSYEEMKQYAENVNDLELKYLIKVVDKYKGQIPDYVKRINRFALDNKAQADIILSTLHRAKGLEYQQLVLEDDFLDVALIKKLLDKGKITAEEVSEEINIIYVALTRAAGVLELNESLSNYIMKQENTE
ncbi:UvrD-helicase domain-containing protein [Halanaerobacter jeridensis]|uniref:Superfamily I DNA/RNA helicase n=1 Tax=Halanaerobacter jeridensis TaxID=706427 RepID=A0A938XN18_9FIRM|nr:UvrD-helicase domain-containing protein [Halanaerobacter jeridensis]MBM7555283.1 superfamily I DNA/RNA helicase [Halanaerobacter jeridensis]